jgi:hypothetical protein
MWCYFRKGSDDFVFAYVYTEDAPQTPQGSGVGFPHNSLADVSQCVTVCSEQKLCSIKDFQPYLPPEMSVHVQSAFGSPCNLAIEESTSYTTLASKPAMTSGYKKACAMHSELFNDGSTSLIQNNLKKQFDRPDIRLNPGSFKITLCVDNQEYYAR